MNSSKKAGGDKTVEVKMAPNTRVKKCQGYGGLKLDEERERMCGNDRKLQGEKIEREEGKGERCEGRRERGSKGVEVDHQECVFRAGWIERVNRAKGRISGEIAACS